MGWRGLTGRVGNRKLLANPLGQKVGDFDMPRNGFGVPRLRVLPKGMLLAFSANDATAAAKVP